MTSRWFRNSFIYLLILVAIMAIVFTVLTPRQDTKAIPISTVVEMAKRGELESLEVREDAIIVTTKSNQTFTSRKESGTSLQELLDKAGVPTGEGGGKLLG